MKRIWQLLRMPNWKRLAVAGVLTAAVAAVVVFGGGSESKTEETTTPVEETTEIVQPELPVSEKEAELLSALYLAMAAGDYNGAAMILNENEDQFDQLAAETLNGEKYSYFETELDSGRIIKEMERITSSSAFKGMVLSRYNTVFYGEFSGGMPNGTCFAIQTMILDQPRYSYAAGNWSNGKMDGEGRTGYYYYQHAPESGYIRTEKRGVYRENLLDGEFVYETENVDGEILTWEMKAVNGVTVITKEWQHYPFRKEYMLGSAENADRVYVLAENKVATVLWNNLISWN